MTTFKIAKHKVTDEDIVECYVDGEMLAVIYSQPHGVRLITRHLVSHKHLKAADVNIFHFALERNN